MTNIPPWGGNGADPWYKRRGTAVTRLVVLIIVSGALIASLNMGIRQTFGLFLPSMTADLGIGREAFAFAIALQNLLWGLFQPLTGMMADKFGSTRVLILGAAVYVLGLVVMSGATGPFELNLGAGLLIGFGASGTGFAILLGAVSRRVSPERRSLALGFVTAGGSFGQFYMAPVGQALIASQGWSQALLIMAVIACLMAPLALALSGKAQTFDDGADSPSLKGAIGEAAVNPGYWFLTLGFFVCGFQVQFIGIHLPSYLQDVGMSGELAAAALGTIGFFNIIGTLTWGYLGGRFSKKRLLSTLYFLRAVAFAGFLAAPTNEYTVMVFAATLGLLWLGTIPLTSGLIAHIFGPRYMATLFGFVFFSHQLGSFMGIWLGGYVFDATGSYDLMWMASIALGLAAALLHMPISERRLREAT